MAEMVLVDAGPLVAMLSASDSYYEICVQEARKLPAHLFTCWPVISEAAYLLRKDARGVAALLSRLERRRVEILPLSVEDVPGVSRILSKYQDQRMQLADVCWMHLADREGIYRVFTIDRKHFAVYRTNAGQSLQLHP
jgi:predicted nucleic acid-binding protein